MPQPLLLLAERLGETFKQHHLILTTAESCTGGSIAEIITAIPGSSQWFDRGFVTYSDIAKQEMLGVPQQILATEGAVSEATVRAMAEGALKRSHAHISIAVTGIAGPSGGTPEKPVGTVWIGWAMQSKPTHAQFYQFRGDRLNIRAQAVEMALSKMLEMVACKK